MTVKACAICVAIFYGDFIHIAGRFGGESWPALLQCSWKGRRLHHALKERAVRFLAGAAAPNYFTGNISNLNVSPGRVGDGVMSRDVMAPTPGMNRYVVAGAYGRLAPPTPQGALRTMVGGLKESIVLRPVAQSGDASFTRFAAGAGGLLPWPDSQPHVS